MVHGEGDKERLSGESPMEARGPLLPLTEVTDQSQRPKVGVHSAVYVTYVPLHIPHSWWTIADANTELG